MQLVKRFAGDPKAPLTPEPGSRNRGGRKANVTPLVEQKMRAMAPEELAAMKNEGMKETFNASITVVRAARNEVLVPLHRGFDGLKFNGGLGGPRARPESQCCARRPRSA